MAFRYQLCTSDGEVFGEASYAYQPDVGDEILVDGCRRMRVLAYVPVERIGEFVDGPCTGCSRSSPCSAT